MNKHLLQNNLHRLYKIAGALAAASILSMMLLVLAQIIAREFFDGHIPSSGDMIGFLVVWSSFLGLAYTLHHQQHIRVEIILSRLSKKPTRWLNIFVGIIASIILIIFSYFTITLIIESFEYNDMTDGEIPLPLWLMQLPMGIGSILFTLSAIDFTWQQYSNKSEK